MRVQRTSYRKPEPALVAVETPAPIATNGHAKASKPWESSLQWWDLPDHGRKWTPNELRKLIRMELKEQLSRALNAAFNAVDE